MWLFDLACDTETLPRGLGINPLVGFIQPNRD
jgi:hypothetical protein